MWTYSVIDNSVYYGYLYQQTNKQILYYPQTLYSVQGVKTSNKYIVVRHLQHKYIKTQYIEIDNCN